MSLLYLVEGQETLRSEPANTSSGPEIAPGDLVVRESGGGCHAFDPADESEPDGLVLNAQYTDRQAEHEYDYRGIDEFTYTGDGTFTGSDLVEAVQLLSEAVTIRQSTIVDNGTDPAPSFQRNDTVGVAALPDGTVGFVQEGYTDNAATEYGNGGAGDFVALGTAEIDFGETVDGYDEAFELRLDN